MKFTLVVWQLSKHDSFNHESIWRISYSSKSEYSCVTTYSISETENARAIIEPCEYHNPSPQI